MSNIVCLLLDTVFFIQCKPVGELDWSEWKEYDEVNLIVCRPVQRQVDRLKNEGNPRAARRARKANSLFRNVISGDSNFQIVKDSNPKVILMLDWNSKPDPMLSAKLDYSEFDDQIVGICNTVSKQSTNKDVFLLTNDTGPLLTARDIGVPSVPIPDKWLLEIENTELERENRKLKEENSRLRSVEPKFCITWTDIGNASNESLKCVYPVYDRLTKSEIEGLMNILRTGFPRASFKESVFTMLQVPPRKEEIDQYYNNYDEWIRECENRISGLYTPKNESEIQGFRIDASNVGTRPASDALVTITAHGDFKISPPLDENAEYSGKACLSQPPSPPQWKSIVGQLPGIIKGFENFNESLSKQLLSKSTDFRRDPNLFYYEKEYNEPSQTFSLECEQWRHGSGDKQFFGWIYFNRNGENKLGKLEIEIHAENLSVPVKEYIHVSKAASKVKSTEHVKSLIDELREETSD